MEPLVHPSELSIWQCFLQARRINRETSRAKSRDWYKEARELEAQLHLFVEGDSIVRAAHRTASGANVTWTDVEPPSVSAEEADLRDYFASYFATHLKKKHRSLGVILHLADEFAISELIPFSEAPADLNGLRERLLFEPREVLEDHSVSTDDLSFRLLPYRGQDQVSFAGVAITISRRHHELLRIFRECGDQANFPVRTSALSAPLEALAALPVFLDHAPGKAFCAFFTYQDFSVVAFFNAQAELSLLRSIRHHRGELPENASVIVRTMAASLELSDPAVYALKLTQQPAKPGGSLPGATLLSWSERDTFQPNLPLEFQLVGYSESEAEAKGLMATRSYHDFKENGWARQDFLPATPEEQQLVPGAVEMRILSIGKLVLRAGVAAVLLLGLFAGLRVFQILRDPAWHTKTVESAGTGNATLQNEINRYNQWDAFLADRSKAWVSMELLSRLFPDPNAVVITDFNHVVRPEAVRDMAKISIVKDWTVSGFANDNALDRLTTLNTREGISAAFKGAQDITGDASLDPDVPSRNLVVNLLASENKRYDPEKGGGATYQFPFVFTLTISQRISSDDPLAIPAAAAP